MKTLNSDKTLIEVTDYAKKFLEVPYIWGGQSFLEGMDCSGLLQHLLLYAGLYDHTDRICKDIKRYLLINGGALNHNKKAGCVLFYGPKSGEETHISLAISDTEIIESGGAGSNCKTREKAKELNAKVRIKPINHRKDFLYSIQINFKE